MEFQLLWHQLLFKLLVKNFITPNYLMKEEANEKEPNLPQYKEQTSLAPKKQHLNELKQPSKLMLSKKDYAPYKDILPSAVNLNNLSAVNLNNISAVQAEADAANAKPCTRTRLLATRLMENGPASYSAFLTSSSMFHV